MALAVAVMRNQCHVGMAPQLDADGGASVARERGRHMLRKRMKTALTVLRLWAILMVGAGAWGTVAAAQPVRVRSRDELHKSRARRG